jgi:outer membrane lipoprotein-sorting protein
MKDTSTRLSPLIVALWMLVLATSVPAQENASGDVASLTPVQILLRMGRVYRGCRSYRDSGRVTTVILTDGGRAGSERPFSTAFVRPNQFRFQFTDPGLGERSSSYIVWMDGDEVRSWWDAKPGVRRNASLPEALGVAAGVSGGSSVRVPGLLLPQAMAEGPLLVAPERIDDGVDRGVACLRIKGKSQKTPYTLAMGAQLLTVEDESITLWIARDSFLLRKVEEEQTFDTYHSESTTTYSPEMNVEIPASQLSFNAPQAP